MRHPLYPIVLTAFLAASFMATSTLGAMAQFSGGDGAAGVSPATPPTLLAPLPTGNSTGINQPGVPNTSTPGLIGTGTTSSGLPGESTRHPGYPGRINGRSH
jgi:hypothetical protein